jgi:hypothetical protein
MTTRTCRAAGGAVRDPHALEALADLVDFLVTAAACAPGQSNHILDQIRSDQIRSDYARTRDSGGKHQKGREGKGRNAAGRTR